MIQKIMMQLSEIFILIPALIFVIICAPEKRYWAALRWVEYLQPWAVFFYGRISKTPKQEQRIKIILLQRMLSAITRYADIELPIRSTTEQVLSEYHRQYGGLILCSAHFGLTMAIFSMLEKQGLPIISISNGGLLKKSKGWNWGCKNPLRFIKKDSKSFITARKKLRASEIILAYSDHSSDNDVKNNTLSLSPNVFKFAYKIKAAILFLAADLATDGFIEIDFIEASYPVSTSSDELGIVMNEFRLFVEKRMGKTVQFRKVSL
jgi:hypothetical protein